MRKQVSGIVAALVLLIGGPALGQVPKEPPATAPELVLDPAWKARPGEKGLLWGGKDARYVFVAADLFAFRDYVKFEGAGDRDGVEQMLLKRRLVGLDNRTPVLVVELHDNPYMAKGVHAVEVRILDGEYKGGKFWALESEVGRLIAKPVDPEGEARKWRELEKAADAKAKEEARARADAPGARAARLLAVARNLEKSGKVKPALENYKKVVADFPNTPAAKEATGRVKALEGK